MIYTSHNDLKYFKLVKLGVQTSYIYTVRIINYRTKNTSTFLDNFFFMNIEIIKHYCSPRFPL